MPIDELCKKTGRTKGVIENFKKRLAKHGTKQGNFFAKTEGVRQHVFKMSGEWQILKTQFDKKELNFFYRKYNKFVSQFNNEVTASEEIQIINLLRFEILINRIMKLIKQNKHDIVRLNASIRDFRIKYQGEDLTEAQMEYLIKTEELLAGAKAGQSAKITELTKLHGEHRVLMKDLKATRDQRLEKVEAASKDFMGLIKAMEERDFREQEGRQLELVKKATSNEAKKLREEIQYPDGEWDAPILDEKFMEMQNES